jgi:WASH complex subunit 7
VAGVDAQHAQLATGEASGSALLMRRAQALVAAARLSSAAARIATTTVHLHLYCDTPMPRPHLRHVLAVATAARALRATIARNEAALFEAAAASHVALAAVLNRGFVQAYQEAGLARTARGPSPGASPSDAVSPEDESRRDSKSKRLTRLDHSFVELQAAATIAAACSASATSRTRFAVLAAAADLLATLQLGLFGVGPDASVVGALEELSFVSALLTQPGGVEGASAAPLNPAEPGASLGYLRRLPAPVDAAASCAALYWIRDVVVDEVCADVLARPSRSSARAVINAVGALEDALPLLARASHVPVAALASSMLIGLRMQLRAVLVVPVANKVEVDARLVDRAAVIPALRLQARMERGPPLRPVTKALRTLRCGPMLVDIAGAVGTLLSDRLYTQAVVFPDDWAAYGQLRAAFEDKFGIYAPDPHVRLAARVLAGSAGSGAAKTDAPVAEEADASDLLALLAGLDAFVGAYSYNLDQQVFVQRGDAEPSSPLLRVLRCADVLRSLRQHGVGVIATCVNGAYGLLSLRLSHLASIFGDPAAANWAKAARKRWSAAKHAAAGPAKSGKQPPPPFPLQLADKLAADLGRLPAPRLSETAPETAVLDAAAAVITEIGNALGLVRLLRAAAVRLCAEATQFSGELSDAAAAADAETATHDLPPTAATGAAVLPRAAAVFASSVSGDSGPNRYFSALQSVFRAELSGRAGAAFRDCPFFVVALLSFQAERMRAVKASLRRDAQHLAACWTDDGFALGLAFLLCVTDQRRPFSALRYFDGVEAGLGQKIDELAANPTARETQLRHEALAARLRELKLIRYSLAASQVFFDTECEEG